MKLLLLSKGEAKVVELAEKHTYIDLKELMGLTEAYDTLDCIQRCINGRYYDFWIDDEGLLKSDGWDRLPISAVTLEEQGKDICEAITGPVLIAMHDEEGATTGLSDDDITHIERYGLRDVTKPMLDVVVHHPFGVDMEWREGKYLEVTLR